MNVTQHPSSPPPLEDLVNVLEPALKANFAHSSVSVTRCPDLTKSPYHLAGSGLCGNECIADIGGQPHLFPEPKKDRKYSFMSLAKDMNMSSEQGFIIGAGAGPFHVLGANAELAPNLSWQGSFDNIRNLTHYAMIDSKNDTPSHLSNGHSDSSVICQQTSSTACALMMNLYGSSGLPGPVLKINARSRMGDLNFTDTIRFALRDAYGDGTPISLGGVFLIKKGRANFHVMPDFPGKPFDDREELNNWLTYHDFDAPIVCLTVMHSADPDKKLGLRMEHTHCFAGDQGNRGGHYHYDIREEGVEEVEYEAYLNTAKVVYRIDKPDVTLEQDLHD